jgi:hypothetical protein
MTMGRRGLLHGSQCDNPRRPIAVKRAAPSPFTILPFGILSFEILFSLAHILE